MVSRLLWFFLIVLLMVSLPLMSQEGQISIPDDDDWQLITAANASQLRQVATLSPAHPTKLFFNADGTRLYSGSYESPIEIWDLHSGIRTEFDVGPSYHGFAISPDDKLLALNSSTDLGGIRLYDLATGELTADIPCSGGSLQILFSPVDSTLLVVGHLSGLPESRLHIWYIKPQTPNGWTEDAIRTCKPDVNFAVPSMTNLVFSPDGHFLLYDNRILDVEKLDEVAVLDYPDGYGVGAAAFSPDSKRLAIVSGNYQPQPHVTIWDVQNLESIGVIEVGDAENRVAPRVSSLAFSPNGEVLAIAGIGAIPPESPYSNFVWLWDVATFEPMTLVRLEDNISVGIPVAFSPNGKLLAIGGSVIYLYGIPENASDN